MGKVMRIRSSHMLLVLALALLACPAGATAAQAQATASVAAPAEGSPARYQPSGVTSTPKVETRWNYYKNYAEATELLKQLAAAYPDLCRLESLGRTYSGKEMWLFTVTDFKTGDSVRKSGMYIDGGIHANEIQATEVVLYTAWYLCEMEAHSEYVARLLDERVFYLAPMLSPDSRDVHLHEAADTHSPRTGQRPFDDDKDGRVDEDGPDDLNGDGHITAMRRKDPNGRWKEHEDYPGMLTRCEPDERGTYTMLWSEGFDNDGDGEVNEDGDGYYDPNRDWAWNWQPPHVQWGAARYPFSILENRMIADFVMAHRNIAGAQSYHNAGGMILRGPGAANDAYPPEDVAFYELIGKRGEVMLPGYKYMITHAELYTVYGGELDWLYTMNGALTFTNELWTSFNYFRRDDGENGWMGGREEAELFNRDLLFGEGTIEWLPFEHPQYGLVEIGGRAKNWSRQPPSFLLEEECHRNMAFSLYHADQLPLLRVDSVEVKELAGGLREVSAVIVNDRPVDSRLAIDRKNALTRPDIALLEGSGFKVAAGYYDSSIFYERPQVQKLDPQRLELPVVPGMGAMYVRWLIEGELPEAVVIDSMKGGVHRLSL